MKQPCEVLRAIQVSATERIEIGETVDAAALPNGTLLIEQKYLRPLPMATASSDGEAALRAQVAELERRVVVLEAAARGSQKSEAKAAKSTDAKGAEARS